MVVPIFIGILVIYFKTWDIATENLVALKGHKYSINAIGVTISHRLVIDTAGVTKGHSLVIDTTGR